MKKKIVELIIVIWMVLSFLIDLISALHGGVNGWLIMILISIEAVSCWIAYMMLIGKRWALITLMIYWGFRTVNIHTDNFSFYTKSGLNVGVSFANTIGVNVLSLIAFILLVREFSKNRHAALPEDSSTLDSPNGQ